MKTQKYRIVTTVYNKLRVISGVVVAAVVATTTTTTLVVAYIISKGSCYGLASRW